MSNKKINVLFFISSFSCGGAENVLLSLIRKIDKEKFNPSLLLLRRDGELLDRIPKDIEIYDAGMIGYSLGWQIFSLLKRVRDCIRISKPDIIFSFLFEPNVLNLFANLFSPGRKLIISERVGTVRYFHSAYPGVKKRIASLLLRVLYPRADRIVSVSEGVKGELVSFGVPRKKIITIYNPLDMEKINSIKDEPIDVPRPYILFAGRLSRQKNIPLLLKVLCLLKPEGVRLLIIGSGEEEDNLKKLCVELELSDRVFFKGFENNPYKFMSKAEVFVLPSDFEGFPNVLIEAMACGTAVISTDCPYGPNEIIQTGTNGLLVPRGDVAAMAEAIRTVLHAPELKTKFVAEAFKKIAPLDIENIMKQYEILIYNVMTCGRNGVSGKDGSL
jgi:glycosyltransferase involved in cell wall biosynthesis